MAAVVASSTVRNEAFGRCWGEGAGRHYTINAEYLDEETGIQLMPVPDSFVCPISAAVMEDPVATVDGCVYESEYIQQWFRMRRQHRQSITSPSTGLELSSTMLLPLVALKKAIETYMSHRPELKASSMARRSFQEAANLLQNELLEKQIVHQSTAEELSRLQTRCMDLEQAVQELEEANMTNTTLRADLSEQKGISNTLRGKFDRTRATLQSRQHHESRSVAVQTEQSAGDSQVGTSTSHPAAAHVVCHDAPSSERSSPAPLATWSFRAVSSSRRLD
mmetsp:Transcript_119665/g.255350  ORF Transcript_119665/g.255350 Transcript_119665/m.255350 type:complete len:278 (+) Transcript_119665:59-892(+)